MGTFGTQTNPAHYVEIPDPLNAGQVKRPTAGQTIKVKDFQTNAALPDVTTLDYGYWAATPPGVDRILVSGDGGITWVGPLISAELLLAAAQAGGDAAEALRVANQTAAALVGLGGGGIQQVNGKTGSAITLTAGDVGARAAGAFVPVGDISGLALVSQTGKYGDLVGTPPTSVPLADKGSPNGVATLGTDGRLTAGQVPPNVGQLDIDQLPDGTWPLRNTRTSDPTARVKWWYYSATSPNPQAGNGYVLPPDVLFKRT